MKACTKPNCNCAEIAEQEAGGPVKNYRCLAGNIANEAINQKKEDIPDWEAKWKEANQFILDLAKELFGNDELGFDGISWSIEDFKNALEKKKEPIQPINGQFIQPVLRWVKAEERLPEKAGYYNVRILEHPEARFFDGSEFNTAYELEAIKWLEELSPSKESQKQSLIELMEADQRDGVYGVSDKGWIGTQLNKDGSYSDRFGVPNVPSLDVAPVASHSSASGNSNEHEIVDAIMNCQLIEFDEPLTEPEKKKMLHFIMETFIMRPLLWYYRQMELKQGIEAMVIEETSKDEFIVSFKTAEEWKKGLSLLNKEQEDNRSVATMPNSSNSPDPQNAQKEPVIDNLRDKFFKECCPLAFDLTYANSIFEWFKPYLKSNSEPVIDWEGLRKAWEAHNWIMENADPIDFVQSNLTNYIK